MVNNKTKMFHLIDAVRKKEFRLKGFISLEKINLSRQKQNYGFYLFDKSWYLPAKHVIYTFILGPSGGGLCPSD